MRGARNVTEVKQSRLIRSQVTFRARCTVFFKANLNADLTLRPAADLKREFEALLAGRSFENVGHQCGSGITACANLFAMEYAGLRGSKLYAGSWSEWIADSARPIAKGR